MIVEGDINIMGAPNTIVNAPVRFEDTATTNIAANNDLFLLGPVTFSGGNYIGAGKFYLDADTEVVADTVIEVTELFWDGKDTGPYTFTIRSGAQLTLDSPQIQLPADGYDDRLVIENNATLTVTQPDFWILDNLLRFEGLPLPRPSATVEGARLITPNDVRIEGNNRIMSDLSSNGIVSPGLSAGVLVLNDNYFQDDSATLAIELGGVNPITEHDQLNITGQAHLNGTLSVSLIDDFEPSYFDEFTIVTLASRDRQFEQIAGAMVNEMVTLAPIYTERNLTLVAALPADANLDGMINFDDFVVLTNNFESGDADWIQADFNLDRTANFDDFVILTNTFGAAVSSGIPVQGVPEPGSGTFMVALMVVLRTKASANWFDSSRRAKMC